MTAKKGWSPGEAHPIRAGRSRHEDSQVRATGSAGGHDTPSLAKAKGWASPLIFLPGPTTPWAARPPMAVYLLSSLGPAIRALPAST